MYTIAKMMVAAKKIPTTLMAKPTPLTYIGPGKVTEMLESLKDMESGMYSW